MGNPGDGQRRDSASALRDSGRPSGGHRARLRQEDPKDTAPRDRGGAATGAGGRIKFDDLQARWLREDPEYRAAHGASQEEYELAAALIAARAHAGLTQEELARRMGTSQGAIARLESGRYLPSSRTLQRFAEATGTRLRISFVAPARLAAGSGAGN